ncbi:MAG: Rrf2 family transcriptional regulator [Victivallales bacterium]|nr:Rrf2 family transcriptional regulator [Victivallales bacterium]MCF7888971.1 Rrf2 family transcriptional regulator [Victivallales bacterium]
MKLPLKSEYAILALIDITVNQHNGLVKTEDVSKRQEIPKLYLDQILLIMKRARLIQSKRGIKGGYSLAKDPQDIFISEIIRLMDGALAPVDSVSKYFFNHTPYRKESKNTLHSPGYKGLHG